MRPAAHARSALRALTTGPLLRVSMLTLAVLAGLPAPQAQARPFKNGELFLGRSIKPSADDEFFSFGAKFSIAPVRAIIKSQVKKQLAEVAKENPEAAALQEHLKDVDTEQLRALANSGQLENFKAEFKKQLAANGGQLSPEQQAAIDAIDASDLKTVADVIDIMNDPDDTLTFALEPWVAFNFKYLRIMANVAIAGFSNENLDMPSLQLGNLGLELSTGLSHGSSTMSFGWTVGVRGYAPTGTEDSNILALSNITAAPRFFHEYATVSPFVVLGLDLAFLQWSIHGEYVHMLAVRKGDADLNDMAYVQAGTGILATLKWVGLSVELDGLFNVSNATAMGGTWMLTTGLRGYVGPVNLGAGVQIPLAQPGSDDAYYDMGGVSTGSPANFNFLVDAKMRF